MKKVTCISMGRKKVTVMLGMHADGQTDGRTDRQTDGRTQATTIPLRP